MRSRRIGVAGAGYNHRVTTFLLIPGAGGRASYWHLVVPILRTAGHTVVAPDLPAADGDAGLDAYLDAVLFALDGEGGADDLVVVGQSLGAFTAPVVAARRGRRRSSSWRR